MRVAKDLLSLTASLFWAAGVVIVLLIVGFAVLHFVRTRFPGILGGLASDVEAAVDNR